jgi:hypothetical protein
MVFIGNNKKYLVLLLNNIYNKVRILLDDKNVLFKEVKYNSKVK